MSNEKAEYRLTKKQKRFADEYLVDCNATQAAIRTGYSPKTANEQGARLLANVSIKKYIEEQLARLHSERTADAQEVIEYLTAVMRGEHKEQTLRLIGEGVQVIADIDVSAKERLKAAELLGKRHGIFKENVSVDISPVTIIDNIPKEGGDA